MVYEICFSTGCRYNLGCKTPGTMEGGFTFVEGSIANPTTKNGVPQEFFVRCPLFRLARPAYMF
jgi:hypothetical protein